VPCCGDVLIGLIRARPVPEAGRIDVPGAGDFAVRRGQSYNTILTGMDTRRPVDVLPDREPGTLAAWLREHPGSRVACRDRAGPLEGIRDGTPGAIQVAGRFHRRKNVCEAAEKTVAAHHRCLRAAAAAQPEPEPPGPGRRLAERTRTRYAGVQECLARGLTRAAAARELNLDTRTARRFANASCAGELPGKAGHRHTKPGPFTGLATQR